MAKGGIEEVFVTVIVLVILAYVVYILVTGFAQASPGFAQYGWEIFLAVIAAIVIAVGLIIKGRTSYR